MPFYTTIPKRMNDDLPSQFDVEAGGGNGVTLKYVGWHEPDIVFQQVKSQ